LCFGGIDPLRLGWRASLDEQLGEDTAAATDVDPSQAWRRCQPFEENLSREQAPTAHAAVVSCSVIETNRLLGHLRHPPLSQHFRRRQTLIHKTRCHQGGKVRFGLADDVQTDPLRCVSFLGAWYSEFSGAQYSRRAGTCHCEAPSDEAISRLTSGGRLVRREIASSLHASQ
jgi:hypothetical protein